MELVEKYVNKYASVDYNSSADESLTHQFKSLLTQCQSHNNKIKGNQLPKMVKKIKLANEIVMLLKMKGIAEQKAVQWNSEKAQLREDLDKFGESLMVAASTSAEHISELDKLREKVLMLAEQNKLLEEKLQECEERSRLREQHVTCLESKVGYSEEIAGSLKEQLKDANAQLAHKKHCVPSMRQNCKPGYDQDVPVNVCPVTEQEVRDRELGTRPQTLSSPSLFSPQSECTRQRVDNASIPTYRNNPSEPGTLKIQDVINLTQVLGKFDTNASAISLSNKLEAVIKQYNLGNKDACALLRAWLPYQLAAELRPPVGKPSEVLADVSENWGDARDRFGELQRIMGRRDTRGANALENARYRRGDDAILFCTDYLSLYKVVFNCPDMLSDDPNFLYSMANKCCVDYNTKIALRYARSYNTFVNVLRDWSQDSFESHRHISVVSTNHQHRRYSRRCFGCGKSGHIVRFCRRSMKQHASCTYSCHSVQRQEGDVQQNLNNDLLGHSPSMGPETVVPSENTDTDPTITDNTGDQKQSQNEPRREFHTPPCNTGKEGTTFPSCMPWVNIPLWLYSSWSHIAMQMLMANLAQFAQCVSN
ncbi:hypothetical protein XENTR_v10019026 [Xenopus tropicalis]|uniref:Posterior protein n=1 Tax=Xenopus tropicalis TaxID=8364 RepID=A0A803J8D8_XENTR|nr:posterior protein [Xenopus tropicalis]KAE8593196.1 hypothetical protein XENTR_v10019026 [Xenopus tropicalis]